jgi:glucose-6-phosphate-specific signal transduction histidine kinase
MMGGRHIVMTDICQIKEAAHRNNELLQENRLLTKNLFKQQEDDSKYLTREIHDELGQWMSAILSQAEVLSTYGDQSDINQIAAKDISKSVGKMHEVVHGLMGRLRPATLDILGLTESLSKLMEDWCFHHPNVRLDQHIDDEIKDVADLVSVAVYRITQEALTNISKYAHPTQVTVRLACNEDNITGVEYLSLIIEENGRGFDPTQKSDGIGIVGMRERVVTLGGEFNMTSSPVNGTQISVRIPTRLQ